MSAMKALLIAGATLVLASPAMAKPVGKLGGKAFVTADKVKDQAADSLAQQFASAPAQGVLARRKNGRWAGTLVAFFKKVSVQGPLVVWVYDKADKEALKSREPVQAITVESTPREVFVHEMDFDPDSGYNKDHVYIVRVGQLIAKKEKIYASGEVKLLK